MRQLSGAISRIRRVRGGSSSAHPSGKQHSVSARDQDGETRLRQYGCIHISFGGSSIVSYKKLWIALGVVLATSFAVLGGVGIKVLNSAPPIPSQVVTSDGKLLFDGTMIQNGQGVWQSIGGQEVGTIWGHGSYVAPDWSADWLHRECTFILDKWAAQWARAYDALGAEQQAALQARLRLLLRTNTYNAQSGRITLDPIRADAFEQLSKYY